MDFGEITEVVPWDILAKDCDQDLDADQQCEPRLFKSHEPWVRIKEGKLHTLKKKNVNPAFSLAFVIYRAIYICRCPHHSRATPRTSFSSRSR